MSNTNQLVVKYSKGGYKVQVYLDKTLYADYRERKKSIREISLYDNIITESGENLSDTVLTEVFGTTDVWICMEEVAKQGEPQYSVQERREMIDKKRKQIVEYIAKTYIDGKTNLPHPATRIDNGLNSIKGLKIDLSVSVVRQGDDIVKTLKTTMSFIKNETHGFLYVSLEAAGKATAVIRKWCEIRRHKYMDNGYKAEVTFATTTMSTFMNELTNVTAGNFRFEDDAEKTTTMETNEEPDSKKGAKGRKAKK